MIDGDYTVREADESDLPGIAELFRRHDYGPQEVDWLRWKYLRNPDGKAAMYVAEDSNHKIVGLNVTLPRRFTSAKTGTLIVWQPVDNFVATEMRNKGIYSKLMELSRAKVTQRRIGFPNEQSIRFDARTNTKTIAPIEEWFIPLSAGQLITGRKAHGFLASLADALSSAYVAFWLGQHPKDLFMKPIVRFDKDFEVDPSLIHGIRSADYLNWRFVDNPMMKHSAYEFFCSGKSVGYCVYNIEGSAAILYDFVTTHYRRGCLRLLIDKLRQESIALLRFPSIGLRLWRLGFIRSRSVNFFNGRDVPEGSWYVTYSDRDV